ncbi:MAG: cysteine synthase [Myxococcales bacterium]|nr:cysteine synthase [Myxococcales bacterium]|tara:strand:+ start:807 stop:1748 length:942 start_codon:yes stop_codon:yes gene_type:complete
MAFNLDNVHALQKRFPTLGLIGNTPLVELSFFKDELPDVRIFAKVEAFNPGGSLKDRPVLFMLAQALYDGVLTPERTILDSSSGNAGIAYAMIGRVLQVPVELVIPDNASNERKKRIMAHGARITFTDGALGYDEALREVRRRYDGNPEGYFFSDQYSNDNNWRAHYETTGQEILAQSNKEVTHFVAGVGTGGCITGAGRRLKEHGVEVHCIRPEEFPGIEGLKPLGNPDDIVPEIFDDSIVDEYWDVTIEDAYDMCQRMAQNGLFVGQSSGAYVAGAYKLAKTIGKGTIVTILCDIGERYFSARLWDPDLLG